MQLEVNEIFASIQGEGHWTGLPVVFLRLQGCNLNPPCAWCDTPQAITMGVMRPMDVVDVMTAILELAPATVVVTGGEPLIQHHVLSELIELDAGKHKWHLETNGTLPIPSGFDWVTVSPKYRDGCRVAMSRNVWQLADEIKVVIAEPRDLLHAKRFYLDLDRYVKLKHIWLQPVSNDPEMTQLCMETLTGTTDTLQVVGLSVQVHKLIGVE